MDDFRNAGNSSVLYVWIKVPENSWDWIQNFNILFFMYRQSIIDIIDNMTVYRYYYRDYRHYRHYRYYRYYRYYSRQSIIDPVVSMTRLWRLWHAPWGSPEDPHLLGWSCVGQATGGAWGTSHGIKVHMGSKMASISICMYIL